MFLLACDYSCGVVCFFWDQRNPGKRGKYKLCFTWLREREKKTLERQRKHNRWIWISRRFRCELVYSVSSPLPLFSSLSGLSLSCSEPPQSVITGSRKSFLPLCFPEAVCHIVRRPSALFMERRIALFSWYLIAADFAESGGWRGRDLKSTHLLPFFAVPVCRNPLCPSVCLHRTGEGRNALIWAYI